jgi:hypothetical protein
MAGGRIHAQKNEAGQVRSGNAGVCARRIADDHVHREDTHRHSDRVTISTTQFHRRAIVLALIDAATTVELPRAMLTQGYRPGSQHVVRDQHAH